MADYLPTFKPGQAITLKASATITGGQLVEVTGSGTVGPAGAASTKVVGVAGFDAATNDNVVIYSGGVQSVVSTAGVTAGDVVQAGAAGTVATGSTAPIGIALLTSGAGVAARVQFNR